MADFKCEVLKVFWSSEPDKKGNRLDIRVVRWGDNGAPVLEKRRMWHDEDTETDMARKLVGFGVEDVAIIAANLKEITQLLEESPNG